MTRAVLPAMRRQQSGHVISISSGDGLGGFEYSSVYAASNAGLEGWMSALAQEVEPFGVRTTIVNPGFFRTGLASPESLVWPAISIEDYASRSAAQREWCSAQDGTQEGDPDKLAAAVLAITEENPRLDASSPAATLSPWQNARSSSFEKTLTLAASRPSH